MVTLQRYLNKKSIAFFSIYFFCQIKNNNFKLIVIDKKGRKYTLKGFLEDA